MQTLQFDEFLRSLKQNIKSPHSFLLGAGASIESGIKSAGDCIWDWKKEIFLSKNPGAISQYAGANIKSDTIRRPIQNWLNAQNCYPSENSNEEYSFYAEKAYRIPDDRRKYFQSIITDHEPSIGYHLISMLAQEDIIKSVWTTNFDGLMVKCAHQYSSLVPIEITADTSDRLYRNRASQELMCIELHGDYKYGSLKNTSNELDSQEKSFVKALLHELTNQDLIVFGYSGRDRSLMKVLETVYSNPGAGKLFWCGYGSSVSDEVAHLIDVANESGRCAYYIATEGFDGTMYTIARHCMSENEAFLAKVDALKKKLSITIEPQCNEFTTSNEPVNKVIETNTFPIGFPKQCYQFQVDGNDKTKQWDYCRILSQRDIMAVPYKGMIYAWGSKEAIEQECASTLKGTVELCPLSREFVVQNTTMRELLLKTITRIIAEHSNLGYAKSKIWDTSEPINYQINGTKITAYQGVKLSLLFDNKYSYITFAPSFMYADSKQYSKEVKKLFADLFSAQINNGRPNKNVSDYVRRWVQKTIGGKRLSLSFPLNSSSAFQFTISSQSALVGVNYGQRYQIHLPSSNDEKRIVFRGNEYKDPTLKFYDSLSRKIEEDFHPMRGLSNWSPIDFSLNSGIVKQSITTGVICPTGYERTFSEFLYGLNGKSDAKHNPDYLISVPGFYSAFKTGIDIAGTDSNRWYSVIAAKSNNLYSTATKFADLIARKIDMLSSTSVDVILIYVPKEYEELTSFSDEHVHFDLHDYIKAYAAQKRIATQFVREKTIESELHCQIMWALSLAIYVKAGRIPWTITGIQPETAFAGIGYSVADGPNGKNIVVGCSHIYSSDGQGMKYKLSKVQDFTLDGKKNPYLSENEAYRLGLNIKDLFHKSFSEMPKRVVIHKRTPFRKEEIKGLVESLSSNGIQNIELLEVTYEDNLKCFALNQSHTDIDGFPVRRGLCFPVNNNTMYLFTHGIAPSVISQARKYFQGGKSIPLPLKIVRHYGTCDISLLATEILGLSKMNWNSFNLYSKLPCTIESSNEIARIGWLLSQFEGTLYDYRFFM